MQEKMCVCELSLDGKLSLGGKLNHDDAGNLHSKGPGVFSKLSY